MAPAPDFFLRSLAQFRFNDLTTHIGTAFPDESTQLSHILQSPDSDVLVKDLANLVAHRGVVFFTNQDLTIDEHKELVIRLGESVANKPKTMTLHTHPVQNHKGGNVAPTSLNLGQNLGWHTSLTFEHLPSDFAALKMHTIASVGGDQMWASGYAAYDKLSPAYQRFLEGLTAVHEADVFKEYIKANGLEVPDNRGSPENSGGELTAIHPVVITNPVTGYKSLYVNEGFTKRILELSPDESDHVLKYLFDHIDHNHDVQVRYRWGKNDVAIWDNRCTSHTTVFDFKDPRKGSRIVGIGPKPTLAPGSKSRKEGLCL